MPPIQSADPILYSFRRCPYAMRARMALWVSRTPVTLREVVLKDKPDSFLHASPSGTVPCLVTSDQTIDESLDIMIWCLRGNDPQQWLEMPDQGFDWINRCDGPFKAALDRTKYATRYPDEAPQMHRAKASEFLQDLNDQIEGYIFGRPTLADAAIAPFVRQFAYIDKAWFDRQNWGSLSGWLDRYLASDDFAAIMQKYPQWHQGDAPTCFAQ